eukprot:JP438930.1.p2 GENE.JP438930.1~~JP438930.1.p2  ORF type:complete len:60 (+),score=8.06 JP438930.1:44-223(+)
MNVPMQLGNHFLDLVSFEPIFQSLAHLFHFSFERREESTNFWMPLKLPQERNIFLDMTP